ncbi:MAG: hypothetical protein U0527_06600 [Candidatus Eisenbacteria bacterium]
MALTGARDESFYGAFFREVMSGLPVSVGIQNAPEYLGVGSCRRRCTGSRKACPELRVRQGRGLSIVIERTIAHLRAQAPDGAVERPSRCSTVVAASN